MNANRCAGAILFTLGAVSTLCLGFGTVASLVYGSQHWWTAAYAIGTALNVCMMTDGLWYMVHGRRMD
jgi:hypothetical protein